MGKIWPLQDAKARLSEVVRAASKEPQFITLRGEEAAVLVSPEDYRRLKGEHPSKSWLDVLHSCPYELEIPPRSRDRGREVDL
jgi:prevent-host-death family protein